MTATIQASINLLFAEKRRLQDAVSYCLNFDSEGPAKTRKLAHLEGQVAGLDEAIGIAESVGRAESAVFI